MTKAQNKAARSFRSAVKSAKRSEQRFFSSNENAWVHLRDGDRPVERELRDENGRVYKNCFCGMRGWYREYEGVE